MGIVSDAVASLPAPSVQGAMIVHPAPMRLEGSGRGGGKDRVITTLPRIASQSAVWSARTRIRDSSLPNR